MADKQIFQLSARSLTITDVLPTQDAAGALDVGKNTIQEVGNLIGSMTTKVSVSSAEILQLNSTPKTLVSAVGANTLLRPVQVFFAFTYNGVAYTTNTNLLLKVGTLSFLTNTTVLPSVTNFWVNSPMVTASLGGASDMFNAPILLSASVGNPAAGTGTLVVYITYNLITL